MRNNSNIVTFHAKEYVRKRVENILDEVIDKPLIMVVAPSGYGKSTLVRRYFTGKKGIWSVWFPLQSDEQDDNWVWKRLCKKIGEYNEELNDKFEQMELPESKQEITYIIKLLNMYVKTPFYIIMDDYQECSSRCIDELVTQIAGSVDLIHIVLISRVLPENIAHEELMLKGKCVCLSQQILKLTDEEMTEIFKENGIELTKKEQDLLYTHTDGWISAVYLCLYEYKKRGRFGNFLGVNHLLKTTIYDKLKARMRKFFMQVSLFDWFDTEGASYVTQTNITENELFECMEKFGFLDYDINSHSFAMHNLFRNVAHMELERSNIDVKLLYDRAGEVSEKRNKYIRAIKYYSKAENWNRIAYLYSGNNGRRLIEQAPNIFMDIKENIKEYVWKNYPTTALNYLYYRTLRDNSYSVMPLYQEVVDEIKNHPVWKNDKRLMGEMMMIKSILEFNDIDKMTKCLYKAQEYFENKTSVIFEKSLLTYGTTCMTILYFNEAGSLKRVVEQEKQYAKAYMSLTKGSKEGWDTFFDAEYALITGDCEKAYNFAHQVLLQNILRNQPCIIISCYYIILKCLIYLGRKEEFETRIKELNGLIENTKYPLLVMDAELVKGYAYACLGQRDNMPEWLSNFRLENCSKSMRNIRSGCTTYGQLMCYEKNWDMLDMIGQQMMVPYENTSHIYPFITGCIYRAIAKYNLNCKQEAEDFLKQAVEMSKTDYVKMPFIENGIELEPLIDSFGMNDFFEPIKPLIDKHKIGINKFLKIKTKDNKYKLTKREAELMEYVKAGYKNAQISEKMHIALVTVEKNLTNIYRKLGVTNRTSAIMKLEKDEQL